MGVELVSLGGCGARGEGCSVTPCRESRRNQHNKWATNTRSQRNSPKMRLPHRLTASTLPTATACRPPPPKRVSMRAHPPYTSIINSSKLLILARRGGRKVAYLCCILKFYVKDRWLEVVDDERSAREDRSNKKMRLPPQQRSRFQTMSMSNKRKQNKSNIQYSEKIKLKRCIFHFTSKIEMQVFDYK